MPSQNLSFRAPQKLLDQLSKRDLKNVKYPGTTAKREVERWYSLLTSGLMEVRIDPVEVVVLAYYANAFNGEPTHANVLNAPYAIGDGVGSLSGKFYPAQLSLSDKMKGWSVAGLYAAWDAVERYEVVVSRLKNESMTFGMALHLVGLHTYSLPPEELARIEQMSPVTSELLPQEYLMAGEDRDG